MGAKSLRMENKPMSVITGDITAGDRMFLGMQGFEGAQIQSN